MNKNSRKQYNISSILKFIIPSMIGVLLFIIPVKIEGNFTIPIAFLSNLLVTELSSVLPLITDDLLFYSELI